jgi:hypothetical protein
LRLHLYQTNQQQTGSSALPDLINRSILRWNSRLAGSFSAFGKDLDVHRRARVFVAAGTVNGVIDLRDVIFFGSLMVFWLFVNVVVVDLKKGT